MQQKRIYFFIGTTAELIKIAPIIREFEKRKVSFTLITSGQNHIHFESLKGFIKKQKADIALTKKKNKSSIFYFLFWGIKTLFVSPFLLQKEFEGLDKKNSIFIIQGDTISSSIGAFIGKINQLQIAHIESGDLSFNPLEPFPEEICRNINIHLADILFPPTDWAKNNLKKLKKPIICTKQNTIIETFWWAMKKKMTLSNIKNFGKYYILILHRQEHVIFRKKWSRETMDLVIKNADKNLTCVMLNHPLTLSVINSLNLGDQAKKIELISQLPYPVFLKLMRNAEFIASDGATHQQETYFMGKPLLSLRDYTEQIEGLNTNVILYKSDKKIMKKFLKNYKKYQTKPIFPKIKPSKIIVDYLLNKNI